MRYFLVIFLLGFVVAETGFAAEPPSGKSHRFGYALPEYWGDYPGPVWVPPSPTYKAWFDRCVSQIQATVDKNSDLRSLVTKPVQCNFRISADGNLIDPFVSNHNIPVGLREATVALVTKASPFPPPPAELLGAERLAINFKRNCQGISMTLDLKNYGTTDPDDYFQDQKRMIETESPNP